MQKHVSTANESEWARERASDGVSVQNIARTGYVAKGIVYGIVAWFAVQAAFSAGEQMTGSKGALASIVSESYGQIMLVLVAAGLAAYAFWRFVQCFVDPEHKGTDLKGLATRALYLASGVAYSSLVIWSGRMVSGSGSGGQGGEGGDSGADSLAATLMSQSYGKWLVAGFGLVIVGVGVAQFVRGYTEKFKKQLKLSEVSASLAEWVVRIGKAGLMARGVVFWIMGGFFVVAAYRANPDEAKGLGESLRALEQAPYGPFLLGVVGVGLVAYAVHQFVKARFRTFPNV